MKWIVSLMALMVFSLHAETYHFQGKHMIASYYGCSETAIQDVKKIADAMHQATRASGATILDECSYVFEPNGLTMVILLSESHASIHTYPEHGACFVDLFTCGVKCSAERFDQELRNYLNPTHVTLELIDRGYLSE